MSYFFLTRSEWRNVHEKISSSHSLSFKHRLIRPSWEWNPDVSEFWFTSIIHTTVRAFINIITRIIPITIVFFDRCRVNTCIVIIYTINNSILSHISIKVIIETEIRILASTYIHGSITSKNTKIFETTRAIVTYIAVVVYRSFVLDFSIVVNTTPIVNSVVVVNLTAKVAIHSSVVYEKAIVIESVFGRIWWHRNV